MKEKLDNEKKTNLFLQTLKRIFIDNPESASDIPGLDNIVPKDEEEAKLIKTLKESQTKIDNSFRAELKVNSSKLKETAKEQAKMKSKNKVSNKEEKTLE